MTTYPATSPEDHFNDELEAIVAASWTPSGIPAPDVHAAMPTDFATVMHRAASAADAREWATLDRIWDAIENDTAVADDTAELPVVSMERNGSMHHAHALTPPNGPAHPIRDVSARRAGWMGRISQGFATAMVIALLVALVGGTYIREFGIPTGSGDPTRVPGLAASPAAATPEGTLTCGAPGYRPVLQGEIDGSTLAGFDLGNAPVVIGEDEITTTLPGGDLLMIPRQTIVNVGPHAIVTEREDRTTTVTRLSDGESWELLSIDTTLLGNDRYYITPSVASTTDWDILDVLTGEQVTTAEILGEPFDLPPLPRQRPNVQQSDDGSVLVLDFNRSALGDPDDTPTGEQPGVLVIPDSLDDAYFKILSPETMVSPDGSLLVSYDEVYDASTGELIRSDAFEGTPIAFTDEPATLLSLDLMEDRVLSTELMSGTSETLYAPDTDIQMVGYDRSAHTMVVGVLDDDNSYEWSWVDLDTGDRVPLPEMSDYALMWASPREPARIVEDVAQFTLASEESPWTVRGLDMNTGRVSSAIEHYMSEDDQWINQVPYLEMGSYLVATDDAGGITVVAPETGERVELSLPPDIEPFPVQPWYLTISPNNACIVLSLYDQDSSKSYISPITEGASWTEVNVRGIRWVETAIDPADTQTLPAQDFATPFATPETSALSCSAPGYVPVVLGEVSTEALAMIGETQRPIVRTESELVVPTSSDGTVALPANSEPLWAVPGAFVTLHPDGSRTITNTVIDESWEFSPLDLDDTDLVSAAFSFAEAGPYVVGPVNGDGTDWTILDARTGDSTTTSELLDGTFPWMVVPEAGGNHGEPSALQAIQFARATQVLPEIGPERLAQDENAVTDRQLTNTLAVILADSVDRAAVVDLGGMTDAFGYPFTSGSPSAITFSTDGSLVAWRGWNDNGDAEGFFAISVARANDLSNTVAQIRIDGPPGQFLSIAFSPDNSQLYIRAGDTFQAITLADGIVEDVFRSEADSVQIQAVNADAGTILITQQGIGDVEHVQTLLLDVTTGETRPLPELDGANSYTPVEGTDLAYSVMRATLWSPDPEYNVTSFQRIVNTATGEIVIEQELPVLVQAQQGELVSAVGTTGAGYAVGVLPDGSIGVLDGNNARSWYLNAPAGANLADPSSIATFEISPSGSCLLLTVEEQVGMDGDRVITEHAGSWILPLEPDAEWAKLPFALSEWWEAPTDVVETLPAPDFATAVLREAPSTPTPDAFIPTLQSSMDHIVNLFAGPTVDAEIITGLPPGTPLMALGDESAGDGGTGEPWIHVRTERGDEGWVVERYLEPWTDSATVTPTAANSLSCASPGYVPVITGAVDTSDLSMVGFDGQAILSTDEGVTVPLPDGTTRMQPPESFIYPQSDLALAIHDDNSATATRISTGASWEYPSVEPRVAEQNWDYFTNGRYVIGPTDDSRSDWMITDTLTGERRTTSDILGEPFEGSFDPLLLPSSDNGDVWVIQFAQIFFSDLEETPPPDTGADPPGYLVIPESLDDAWFSDRLSDRHRDEITVSPGGTTFIVAQTVRDPRTGERVDSGGDNLTYFGKLIAYLDESTLLTFNNTNLQSVDVSTGATTTIHTARGRIQNAALDADAGMVVISSGTQGPIKWELIDLTSGEVTPLPDLAGYQLANTSGSGGFARVDTAAAFFQYGAADEIEVRALDMRTGAVSPPVTARTDSGEAPSPWSHVRSQGQYVHTTGDAGTVTFIDAPTGDIIQLPLPENVSIPNGEQLDIAIVPGERCATLTLRDPSGQPVGHTWVAPIETGATWMELPFSIDGWRKLHIQQGQTPPAQDLSTPISNDATSAPTSEAFAPMSSVPGV